MIRKFIRYCIATRKRRLTASLLIVSLATLLIAGLLIVDKDPPTITIPASQLQAEISYKNTFYRSQNNSVDQQTLRQDVINQLARDHLVNDYAVTHNVTVTQNEVDAIYQQRVHTAKSEQALLSNLRNLYGIDKQQYRNTIELDILKEKVQTNLHEPLNVWLNKQLSSYRIVVTN